MPININEYGNRRDLSNPGQLVQWIAMFEDTKADADLAFWDIAGNYSDNAVGNNQPNGSWWLLRWYGAMTGHTAAVTPPAPTVIDTLAGLASLDPGKRQARLIVAHPLGGDAAVAVSGLSLAAFGGRVHVSVQSTTWTGYDGVASTPLDVAETDYHVTNGQITVPLGAMDPMTAYQIIISPAIGPQPAAVTRPWIGRYLAAEATLTAAIVRRLGSPADPNGYAAPGGAEAGPPPLAARRPAGCGSISRCRRPAATCCRCTTATRPSTSGSRSCGSTTSPGHSSATRRLLTGPSGRTRICICS